VIPRAIETALKFRAMARWCFLLLWIAPVNYAFPQSLPQERTFSESKATVERALKSLQPAISGRLPVLDGFVVPGEHSLEHFQRGYYQCTVQVNSTASGGALVRVTAKITAWYTDQTPEKSGYRVLPSNGRLEGDLLAQLEQALSNGTLSSTDASARSEGTSPAAGNPHSATPPPTLSAPMPRLPDTGNPLSSGLRGSAGTSRTADQDRSTANAVAERHRQELTTEAQSLEEILRNQSHPDNLVAVKKDGTPVLGSPAEGAKVLFSATAEDEFEILDMNADWVHVRISGLSRGWIRRSSLEMPASSSAAEAPSSKPQTMPAQPFQIENEETASFPGEWEPLRGKTVEIVTVQKATNTSDPDPSVKLAFAKSLFEKEYAELKQTGASPAGIVLIFDSADGGMIAAPIPVLQQWKAGDLSEQAFWRRCFFDPPEMTSSSPSQ